MRKLINRVIDSKSLSLVKTLGVQLLLNLNISLWAKLHTGQTLKVDMSSSVGRSIYLRGVYEPEAEQWMRRLLRSGDAFIDVGANIGYFTIICAELVGPDGEVHSFDPHKKANQLLAKSVKKNGYANIHVNQLALSDREEILRFVSLKNSAFSWTRRNNARADISQTAGELVPAIPLDQYVHSRIKRRIGIIKIDVEGAEYNVLIGARQTLMRHSPCIIIETQDWSLSRYGHSIDNILNFICEIGYQAFDLAGEPVKDADDARQRLKDLRVQNLVFKKEKNYG